MKNICLVLFLLIPVLMTAQAERKNTANVLNLGMEYGTQIPGGDLDARFGRNGSIGGKFEFIFKSNWTLSIDGSFIFGRNVKEDPIAGLRDSDSLFIGANFIQASIFLRQRGFYMGTSVGKLIPINPKKNNRSGIKIDLGIGLLQHKIRIQDDPESFVPILTGDYKKGFDRLTNGLALRQFIGYEHLAKNRLINFYAGFEFTQSFTQNRRSFNFDTRSVDNEKRVDLLSGIKVGWILPFYVGETAEEIFY